MRRDGQRRSCRAWNQIAWAGAAVGWGEEALAADLLDAATAVGDELGARGVIQAAQHVRVTAS